MKKTILALALCLCLCWLAACEEKTADVLTASPAATSAASAATPAPTPVPTLAPVLVNGQSVPADCQDLVLAEAVADPGDIREGLAALRSLKTVTLDRTVPEAETSRASSDAG